MHQQLSLYASTPNSELKITLHTLAALSGMHPRSVHQHCLVWKPKYPFVPVLKAGEVNQIEQYRITMTNDDDTGSPNPFMTSLNVLRQSKWSIKITEVPEPGKRPVVSQSQLHAKLNEGDPFVFMSNLGYGFEYEYWLRGYRFVFGAIVLNLFRVYKLKKAGESKDNAMEIDGAEIAKQELELLDSSGRWTIKAHIDVQQLTDMEAMKSATQQLERLQSDLVGLFDLKVIERMSLDTRISRR